MNRYTVPIPNIRDAQEAMVIMLREFDEQNFYNPYTPQLVTTNELPQILNLEDYITPNTTVCTVCGSGEQPFFAKLFGAKYVLTFDISYNAYLLMALKIAAMQYFKQHAQYEYFISDLGDHCGPGELLKTPNIDKVLKGLYGTQRNHLIRMESLRLPTLLGDASCQYYTIPQNDYEKLRTLIRLPFPFIWTDIKELDTKLGDDTFDIMYYSNVLCFVQNHLVKPVLESTKKHLNPDGKLFLVSDSKYLARMMIAVDNVFRRPEWDKGLFQSEDGFFQIIVQRMQRAK